MDLLRRYKDEDLRVFSPEERVRFLGGGTSAPPIDRSLAFELLYRLEPDLYDRLIAAERIHPAVLEWLPRVDRVVEVGAGTGRLTEHLLTLCAHLVAVEPARPMREWLSAALFPHTMGQVEIIEGFFDALPVDDESADMVVTCAALDRDTAHGGDAGLAEMERVCAPGGVVVVVWPNHLDWLRAHGFTYLSFPGPMWMEFRDAAEAIEMTEIFYPHAAAEVRARGSARVEYDVLGVNPPRDLVFTTKSRT
ncbi:MAG: class I SAM-dependent methyltransferase [Candidatus Dormiibacterota bacterium]